MAKSLKNQSFKYKARLQRVANATTEMNREIDAEEISETNVNELPDDLRESIIHVTDEQLIDDPSNISLYGEYEVEELSEIMKNRGFQGVILAYPVGNGKYMIEAGHRRRYAAKKAGFLTYPVLVTQTPETEFERVLRLTGANLHNRPELKPMQMANLAQTLYHAHKEEISYKKEKGLLKEDEITSLNELVALDLEMTVKNVEKYRRLLNLIPELQEIVDRPEYPWSYIAEASNLPAEKQKLLEKAILDREKTGKKNGPTTWIKTLIKKMKNEQEIANIEGIKESDCNGGRVRRKNGTKVVLKTAKELHEVLDKEALFKKEEIPDVISVLEGLKKSIEAKIDALKEEK